ncbi:MAG: insulinase family protein [Muribaculaceae bacterium]|nr:insulinase family protein [Muribaculaceae bacterium]
MRTHHAIVLLLSALLTAVACGGEALPIDPELRLGTLPCGITYYIRHNSYPQGRAEMWMAHRVGSVVETADEQGYAHLLEHMAFNGTTHYPATSMVNYLTSTGMTYGSDINASTSYDDTQYQLSNVPTDNWATLDSALLALSDLSTGLTLDPEAIEKEKWIIAEERRHRDEYQTRMFNAVLPQLLGNNPYATRTPIGQTATIEQADQKRLTAFYRRWFRPDLQAIVIVGDFDTEVMEQHVRQTFASVPAPAMPCPDPNVDVTLAPGIHCARYADPEAGATTIRLLYPIAGRTRQERNTADELRDNTLRQLVATMIAQRLDDRAHAAQSHILASNCATTSFMAASHTQAIAITATTASLDPMPALAETLTEVRRVVEHGFTSSELKLAVANHMAFIELSSAQMEQHTSRDYVMEYIDHFLHGSYIPGIKQECAAVTHLLDTATVADANQMARQMLEVANACVVFTASNKATLPTKEQALSVFAQTANLNTDAPDEHTHTPLPTTLSLPELTPGRIVDKRSDTLGITTLKLSNGATVQLMPTTHQTDEVLFCATRPGGFAALGSECDRVVRLVDNVVENSSLGSHSEAELRKMLSGTTLSIVYSLGETHDEISGQCRRRELETLLQLNHLYFTNVKPDTAAYRNLRKQLIAMAHQTGGTPEAAFADSTAASLYNHRARYLALTEAEIAEADFESALTFYRQRVARPQDYTFILVGDLDTDSVQPLIERYIASLPAGSTGPDDTAAKPCDPYPSGDIDNVFLTAMPSPKANIYACQMGAMEPSLRNSTLIDITGQVLAVYLNAHLRENLQATYCVEAHGAAAWQSGKWILVTQFDTQPELTQTILGEMAKVFDLVMSYGSSNDLLEHIRRQLLQQLDTDQRTNAYWIDVLRDRALGFDRHTGYRELLETLTANELNTFINNLSPTLRLRVVQQGYRNF